MLAHSFRRRFAYALIALTFVAVMTPASAVQTQHAVVVTDDPADWTPDILDGQVNAVLQMGTKVIVGGQFTQVRRHGFAQIFTRNNIFAFDMNTGIIDQTFVPQLNGTVEALAAGPDGQSVYAGGSFNSVNGDTGIRRLVRLSIANGQAVAGFRPNPSAAVLDLVIRGAWLYVSGQFQTIGGTSRGALARLDPSTGAVDSNLNLPFSGPGNGGGLSARKIDVTPDGTKLVAIGNFSLLAGQPRTQMAIIDLPPTGPATVSSWQTTMTPFVDSGQPDRDVVLFRVRDLDARHRHLARRPVFRPRHDRRVPSESALRFCVSLVDGRGGTEPTALVGRLVGRRHVLGRRITGPAVYVGGHPRWMNNPYLGDNPGPGAVPREGVAALDPVNGLPLSCGSGS